MLRTQELEVGGGGAGGGGEVGEEGTGEGGDTGNLLTQLLHISPPAQTMLQQSADRPVYNKI